MNPHSISQSVFDRIMAFLTNLFLPTNDYEPDRARDAALEALAEYDPRTNRELRLAALALAFSLGALDALSRAVDEELSLNQMLRLRSSANALHRSARQAEQALAEERETPDEETERADAPLPASTEPQDLAEFSRTTAPLSRQQRRRQERDAEKRRRRQEEQVRLTAREAHRGMQQAPPALTSPLPPAAMVPPGTAGAGAYATSAVA
jgi:hypothetical protein